MYVCSISFNMHFLLCLRNFYRPMMFLPFGMCVYMVVRERGDLMRAFSVKITPDISPTVALIHY